MIRVGIPRALQYYQYYPMWRTFFEGLGASVVLSPTTTQSMLLAGSSRVVADTCLPVKVFLGHVLSLVGQCDYIFIPAIRSVKNGVFNCAKFLGLPDMTRAVLPESPPILDIDIDVNKGKRAMYQAVYKLGRHFNLNPLKIRQAAISSWHSHLNYSRLMSRSALAPPQAIEILDGSHELKPGNIIDTPSSSQVNIALIGHPYILYDEHINYRLINRLQQCDIRILTPEMVTDKVLNESTARLAGKAYWTYEHEVVGAGEHYLSNGADGIIGIMAFGCGPDSLMMDMVRRQAARLRTSAFMNLTLEEHTAEAGIVTRLEAFLDMIYRKKSSCVEICA
ncbi:acyl-CoA dehydratase activase-related protein [Chloroflexota bacterium]